MPRQRITVQYSAAEHTEQLGTKIWPEPCASRSRPQPHCRFHRANSKAKCPLLLIFPQPLTASQCSPRYALYYSHLPYIVLYVLGRVLLPPLFLFLLVGGKNAHVLLPGRISCCTTLGKSGHPARKKTTPSDTVCRSSRRANKPRNAPEKKQIILSLNLAIWATAERRDKTSGPHWLDFCAPAKLVQSEEGSCQVCNHGIGSKQHCLVHDGGWPMALNLPLNNASET